MTLRERLADAEAGGGGLDGLMWEATGHCAHRETKYYAVQSDTGFECVACGIDMYGVKIPKLSQSIDDILTLIEGQFGADVIYHMGRIPPSVIEQSDTGHGYYFDLPEAEHVSSPGDIHATGHTLALAACAALASQLKDKTNEG